MDGKDPANVAMELTTSDPQAGATSKPVCSERTSFTQCAYQRFGCFKP